MSQGSNTLGGVKKEPIVIGETIDSQKSLADIFKEKRALQLKP